MSESDDEDFLAQCLTLGLPKPKLLPLVSEKLLSIPQSNTEPMLKVIDKPLNLSLELDVRALKEEAEDKCLSNLEEASLKWDFFWPFLSFKTSLN